MDEMKFQSDLEADVSFVVSKFMTVYGTKMN